MTIRIGLTGPIGCGKSTVAGWLAEQGAAVVDADRLAREVTAPGTPGLDRIVEAFGREVLATDGGLDRAKLAQLVFGDAEALARLEAITHPLVRPKILEAIRAAESAGRDVLVLEAIRLVEGGYAPLLDEVWLVVCAPDAQRARLAGRGMDAPEAERRIAAQAGLADRVAPVATRTIDTSADLGATMDLIRSALEAARVRATGSRAGGDPEVAG